MTLKLPTIYPITDCKISGLSHIEQVRRLIEGGARLIQIRDKEAQSRDFLNAAVEAVEFARTHGVSIVINDRVDVALAAKAAGVHLGQDDVPPEKARALLGEDAIIGFSTHTPEQAIIARELPIDYVAFGPIFATSTKRDAEEVVGLDPIRIVREVIGGIPLVAIGGIGEHDIATVIAAGADSVAMISGVIRDPTIIARTRGAKVVNNV